MYYDGKPYAMQQLPVSWVDGNTGLVCGPGAYIHPTILARELQWIESAIGYRPMVHIDYRCGIHTEHHTELAQKADRHHKMGATGKGCSEAVVHKIKSRGDVPATFVEWLEGNDEYRRKWSEYFIIRDTVSMVNEAYDRGETLIIEGTQGTLLDLHLGPYPYTTHKQTQAASWLAEAGLSANVKKEIWGVYRTFPIRVAGNSGPMPGEMSWVRFTRILNSKLPKPMVQEWALADFEYAMRQVARAYWPELESCPEPSDWAANARQQFKDAASEIHREALEVLSDHVRRELFKLWEVTTVTRKLRRIAQWDWGTFRESIMLNRPDFLALTFMNYEFPGMWGWNWADREISLEKLAETKAIGQYIREREKVAGCPVGIVSFGPDIKHTHTTGRIWETMHHDNRSESRV